jgi:hypothetical protein
MTNQMIAFEICTYGTQLQLPFYHLSVEAKFFIIAKSFEEETFLLSRLRVERGKVWGSEWDLSVVQKKVFKFKAVQISTHTFIIIAPNYF